GRGGPGPLGTAAVVGIETASDPDQRQLPVSRASLSAAPGGKTRNGPSARYGSPPTPSFKAGSSTAPLPTSTCNGPRGASTITNAATLAPAPATARPRCAACTDLASASAGCHAASEIRVSAVVLGRMSQDRFRIADQLDRILQDLGYKQ